MHTYFLSALLGGAITFACASPAGAQNKTSDSNQPSQSSQIEALSALDVSELQKLGDQDAEAAANDFMTQYRANKTMGSDAGHSFDIETGTTEFPGDLFNKVDSFQTQTDFIEKRLRSGKRSRAIYQLDSQYREDLTVIGEMSSKAAQALKGTDPKSAKEYAEISRQIMMSVMTPSDPDNIKSQSKWLSEVDGAINKIAVLRKKPAR